MNRLQLIKILHKHLKLSEKRSLAWEQNKIAKYSIYIVSGIVIAYLVFIAIMLSLIINDSESVLAYEFMYGIAPFILSIDFLSRFAFQQTPSQLVKPYSLLPISRYACIDCFLVNTVISSYNFLWFALYIPFALMSILFSEGLIVSLGFLTGLWLFSVINSQWYLLVRSLVNKNMAWWILPIIVYALVYSPWYIGANAGIGNLLDTYMMLGEGFSFWHLPNYAGAILAIIALLEINRRRQYVCVWRELSKIEKTEVRHLMRFTFLERMGKIGEYMKIEIKSIMRNANVRKTFISGTAVIVLFSLLLSFSDIYDGVFMSNFWCIYCFAIYGAMILVKIMCYEGNYIDCLMVRKENIIMLLTAKYYIYSALLVFPFILMLPTVFTGKCTLLMLMAYAAFTAGVEYFLFFQMAVYNKQTIPLNTKFIGKGSMENNYMQIAVEMIIFIVPISFIMFAQMLFSETIAHIIILAIGILFIALHHIWIANIYRRLMKRRYANMESLRASR